MAKSSKHTLEKRPREIHENYCAQKGCVFYGKPAQQGVCFSDKPEVVDWDRLARSEAEHYAELEFFRKKYRRKGLKKYVEWLEAMSVCESINANMVLDELIRLRRENALFRLSAQKQARRKPRRSGDGSAYKHGRQ